MLEVIVFKLTAIVDATTAAEPDEKAADVLAETIPATHENTAACCSRSDSHAAADLVRYYFNMN